MSVDNTYWLKFQPDSSWFKVNHFAIFSVVSLENQGIHYTKGTWVRSPVLFVLVRFVLFMYSNYMS
jgi:hypothetical protein